MRDRPWEELLYDPDPSTRDTRPPTYSASGVNLGQIRRFLSLTPAERLAENQNIVNFIIEARNATEAARDKRSPAGS